MNILWVHAAEVEVSGLRGQLGHVLRLGVGKSVAAARLARALALRRPELVVAFGVAGTPPPRVCGEGGLGIGATCLVEREALGDEGVETPAGFLDLDRLGLLDPALAGAGAGPWRWCPTRGPAMAAATGLPAVGGLTVSACSGTEALAMARWQRHGAAVETMEGAAVAIACAEAGMPWLSLRAISNYTGDRERAGWALTTALDALAPAVVRLRDALGAKLGG